MPVGRRLPSAGQAERARTAAHETIAGFVLSALGCCASVIPGNLLVAVPLLLAGLYVSIAVLGAGRGEAIPRGLAISGIVMGILGLCVTLILFAIFVT